MEVYVQPFPPGDGRSGRVRVSPAGGTEPRWRADGKELYYRAADGKLMAVDIAATDGPVFRPGLPRALFAAQLAASVTAFTVHYDVTGDGKRFLLGVPSSRDIGAPITVVLNWESALRR